MHTILVVDDTPDNIELLSGILTPEYRVLAAINGERALKIAESMLPDLILLDVVMPGMDGYEVLTRLKNAPTTQAIPVIFLSSKVAGDGHEKGVQLGAFSSLSKPVDPVLLRNNIMQALRIQT